MPLRLCWEARDGGFLVPQFTPGRGVNTQFADLSLGRCRWLEAGAGAPAVLLHGMGAFNSADNLADLAARLAPDFRVLVPDLLGFGLGTRRGRGRPHFRVDRRAPA